MHPVSFSAPDTTKQPRAKRVFFAVLFFCALPAFFSPFADSFAASGTVRARLSSRSSGAANLENQIHQEQTRAKARRENLSRLTDEERRLDKDLAATEVRILRLEASLAKEGKTLENLASSDEELAQKGESILAEMGKTEEAMLDILRILWEIHARREGVKGRDLPDWPITDREHAWSVELLASLDAYRKNLAGRQKDIDVVVAEREKLALEVRKHVYALNREKEELLQARLRYAQSLSSLRAEKRDTEKELSDILALVQSLNLQLQAVEEGSDIAKAKGKLPWPVTGKVHFPYSPFASPPVRGITLALEGASSVKAVHWGKVVHNDILRGIGRVVILMHGEEYFSLYAFLSESPLRIGQEIARGDIVGTSGFVPSLNGAGLYFELRFHQKAVNPEDWLRK
ncbi:peptidase M24 [Deltaproteobacteria bacterium]|nr:peptidase M24 [Deltaproteobacteria bacterium]